MSDEAKLELVKVDNAMMVRQSTDVAGLCKELAVRRAIEIQGKKYIPVEVWQSIATAHGCAAGARDVEKVQGGYRAIGYLKRMSDGVEISSAEGFVGEDEPTWYGGEVEKFNKYTKKMERKTLPKRPEYAVRAMAQTRAISRVCRSAFAHVVVLMDAGLSTTPAEEVPEGGFHDDHPTREEKPLETESRASNERPDEWQDVVWHLPFGGTKDKSYMYKGNKLIDILNHDKEGLSYWFHNYEPSANPKTGKMNDKDLALRAALNALGEELEKGEEPPQEDPPESSDLVEIRNRLALEQINEDWLLSAMKKKNAIKPNITTLDDVSEVNLKKVLNNWDSLVQKHKEEKQ